MPNATTHPFADLEARLADPPATGILITGLEPGPALDAGLEVGDIIVAINGVAVSQPQQLVDALNIDEGELNDPEDGTVDVTVLDESGEGHTLRLPRQPANMVGIGITEGEPAWTDTADPDYEPDFSIVDRNTEIWLRTLLDGQRAGFEHIRITSTGSQVVFDHLVNFGGEAEGGPWTYRERVVSTHRLERMLPATAVSNETGSVDDGVDRVEMKLTDDQHWRGTATHANGETTPLDVKAPVRDAINAYGVLLLATTLPLKAGMQATFPVVGERSGVVRGRSRLVCKGLESVDVGGAPASLWAFEWQRYGSTDGNSERFFLNDNHEIIAIDWGPGYGGCRCEVTTASAVKKGLPAHINVR